MTPDSGLSPRIFTIPASQPFLRLLAEALCDGRLTPDYRYDPADPLSLSKVTILVPTRRAARVLRAEFATLLGGRSAILPIIKPLGETDEDGDFFEPDLPEMLDFAQPVSGTVRLLELARLILAWRNKLPEIVRSIHTDSPLVAPASPADAVWLARALIELIDAVETEERDWDDLSKLDARDFASWWQLTLEFLRIANAFWPERLKELNRSSPSRHRNTALRAEARRLSGRASSDPVIVAGSTGSIPAAADLIAAIAEHPHGVIVVPGLDTSLPEADWGLVAPDPLPGRQIDPSTRCHPQYGLHHLLSRLRIPRDAVISIGDEDADLADRARILSQAMAPAAATDNWTAWRQEFGTARLAAAFDDVALIEAANEREEATAIAIALRMGLDLPGADGGESTVALITPDRALARRVAAELARFGIVADDSAGTPINATAAGTLVKLLLEAALRPGDPVSVVSLLKHPLCRFGLESTAYRESVQVLEILCLRGGVATVDVAELAPLLAHRIAIDSKDNHAPQWRLNLGPDAAEGAAALAARIAEALEPLTSVLAERRFSGSSHVQLPLQAWAERTGRAIEAACSDEKGNLAELWSSEAGETLARLLSEIMATDGDIDASGNQFVDIMDALMAGEAVKPKALRHPRVFIFGTLEARLQRVDTMVVGGLNEGSWPGQTANNPFLSRTMKTEIGLEPPERRIGQQAHDFAMASGTRRLFYSRALRQGGAPTVASRWLQRLLALGGPGFAESLRRRGERFRHFADKLDKGASQRPAQRPEPRPSALLQPKSYSFSEVGRLRRDPYSIYARRILRLDPVDPFNRDPGASERGTLYHGIVEHFVREGHAPDDPAAEELLSAIANRLFDAENLPPHIDVVWRLRFGDVGRAFLAWEHRRRPTIRQSLTEVRASLDLPAAGIRLTGLADRIDIKAAGYADVIDYKTGSNPSVSQARSLLDPQLALEAAALRGGAFRGTGALAAENLIYVRLRPGSRFKAETVNNEMSERAKTPKSAGDLATEAIDQLLKLVMLLQSGQKGFVSRLIPAMQNDYSGDYDHLARVAEWSTAEASEVADD